MRRCLYRLNLSEGQYNEYTDKTDDTPVRNAQASMICSHERLGTPSSLQDVGEMLRTLDLGGCS